MSLLMFFIGSMMMLVGFFITWKTNYLVQWFGDIGEAFGVMGMPWMSWKLFGVALLFIGFFLAFGLFEAVFTVTLGRLFMIGELQ